MYRFFYFLFIFFVTCSQPKDNTTQIVKTIEFDITQDSEFSSDDVECLFIPLETKEDYLLSLAFEDVLFTEDRIFTINFHDNKACVFVFNINGQFIDQIGSIGNGPGEYHQPYKLHINKEKNRIIVADRHLNKLLTYDLANYQYISSTSIPFNFSNCIWLSDEYILWYNEGGIDTGKRSWHFACITNEEMTIIESFHETKRSSYLIGYTTLYKYKNQAYLGLPFSPFIYQTDAGKQMPVWKLSFGKQKLPPKSLVEDEKENSMAWQNKIITSDYIIAFHAHETTDCLGVSFYGKTFQRHLGFYDKRTETTHAYTAMDFMKKFDLYGVYDIINTYNDYFVARIEPRLLKKYSSQREDLRRIEQNMTEEDNPVLCLFKFK